MAKRRKRFKRSSGTGFLFVVVIAIFGTIMYARKGLDDQRTRLLESQAMLESQIEDEQERADQITELEAYVQTKKYIEDMAREKFGLVYKDEIIFRSSDGK